MRLVHISVVVVLSVFALPLVASETETDATDMQKQPKVDEGPACHSPHTGVVYQEGETYTMLTSWYGEPQPTASGVRFDPSDPTMAAHKVLPFGTKLLAENPKNGRTQIITIVDAGPFIDGRNLDISIAAAKKLGFVKAGVTELQVTILNIPQDTHCRS